MYLCKYCHDMIAALCGNLCSQKHQWMGCVRQHTDVSYTELQIHKRLNKNSIHSSMPTDLQTWNEKLFKYSYDLSSNSPVNISYQLVSSVTTFQNYDYFYLVTTDCPTTFIVLYFVIQSRKAHIVSSSVQLTIV